MLRTPFGAKIFITAFRRLIDFNIRKVFSVILLYEDGYFWLSLGCIYLKVYKQYIDIYKSIYLYIITHVFMHAYMHA